MVCDEIEKIERAGNRAKNQTGGNMFGGVSTIIASTHALLLVAT